MTEYILNSLAGLFSLSSLISFCAGVCTTIFYYYFEERRAKKHKCNGTTPKVGIRSLVTHPLLILWTFLFLLAGFLGFQQYTTARDVRVLAEATRACQIEFNHALRVRSNLGASNDELNRQHLVAVEDHLRERLNPPPEIYNLMVSDPMWTTDPRVIQWRSGVDRELYEKIKAIFDRKVDLDEKMNSVPLPEPTCGE